MEIKDIKIVISGKLDSSYDIIRNKKIKSKKPKKGIIKNIKKILKK